MVGGGCDEYGHRLARFYALSRLYAMTKLQKLREAKGWTIQETARRAGVGWQSIGNLEDATTERPGDPAKATVATATALMEVFYPKLQLRDFVPTTNLQIVSRTSAKAMKNRTRFTTS